MGCEQITLGQIAAALAFIAALIASCGTIYHFLNKAIKKLFKEQLKGINDEIGELKKNVDRNNLESCKNYLVYFISDVERGEKVDDIQLERFYEEYETYKKAGGNSYIKHKVEKLKTDGKL